MKILKKKAILVSLVMSLLFATSCGTLVYPDRHGQPSGGNLDGSVVLMDGVLLLIGIIPGVVAFAVDLHTNAIYLPPEGVGVNELPQDKSEMRVVHVDGELTASRIEAVLSEETGKTVDLSQVHWEEYKQ